MQGLLLCHSWLHPFYDSVQQGTVLSKVWVLLGQEKLQTAGTSRPAACNKGPIAVLQSVSNGCGCKRQSCKQKQAVQQLCAVNTLPTAAALIHRC
jgi:hypothetical protein